MMKKKMRTSTFRTFWVLAVAAVAAVCCIPYFLIYSLSEPQQKEETMFQLKLLEISVANNERRIQALNKTLENVMHPPQEDKDLVQKDSASTNHAEKVLQKDTSSHLGDGASGRKPTHSRNTNNTVVSFSSEDTPSEKNSSAVSIYVDGPELLIKGCNSNPQPRMTRSDLSLAFDLNCDTKDPIKKTLNFFSAATGDKFEDFLPMYAFYALSSNDDAVVEMVVKNSTHFISRKNGVLSWLSEFANDRSGRICVRNFDFDHIKRKAVPNTWRFLEVPHVLANYTYMADTDIFLLESVLAPERFQQMAHFKIPYSNMIRLNTTRLTGVMLADTEHFYTPSLIKAQHKLDASGNDEVFLYNVVKEAGLGLPVDTSGTSEGKFYSQFRPIHGTHLSFNRGPGKRLCTVNMKTIEQLLNVKHAGEFFCRDKAAYDPMSKAVNASYIQEQGSMTVNDGICK